MSSFNLIRCCNKRALDVYRFRKLLIRGYSTQVKKSIESDSTSKPLVDSLSYSSDTSDTRKEIIQTIANYSYNHDLDGVNKYCEELYHAGHSLPVDALGYINKLLSSIKDPIDRNKLSVMMLKYANERDDILKKRHFKKFLWEVRNSVDPFARLIIAKELSDYINRYDRNKSDMLQYREHLESNLILSYLNSHEYEIGFSKVLDILNDNDRRLSDPVLNSTINKLCVSFGDCKEAIDLLKMVEEKNGLIGVSHKSWIYMLEASLSKGYYEGVRFVWDNYIYKQHGRNMSNGYLIRILESAGEVQDYELVEEVSTLISRSEGEVTDDNDTSTNSTHIDYRLQETIARSVINGLLASKDKEQVLSALDLFITNGYKISYRDIPHFGEWILEGEKDPIIATSNTIELLTSEEYNEKKVLQTLIMNCILDHYSNSWAATGVMYTYRLLLNEANITPDIDTFRLLINSAYRLGNCKKLTYTIYNEMRTQYSLIPTTSMYETILKTQLIGRKFDSTLYFLREMRIHKIILREHIHHYLKRQTIEDTRFREIFSLTNSHNIDKLLNQYSIFPPDSELEQTSTRRTNQYRRYSYQRDILNCASYISGWQEKDLPQPK